MKRTNTKLNRRPAGLQVRPFRLADYPAVAELWQTSGLAVDSREQVRRRLKHDRGLFLVAEVKGKLVGVAMGAWDGRRASLWRLAVHPDFQRRGVARALMSELESRLQALGTGGAFLLVWHENRPALKLYQKCGYEPHPGVLFMYKEFPAPQTAKKRRQGCDQ